MTTHPTPDPDRLRPVGVIRSDLRDRAEAPKQGSEGAPDAWLQVHPWAADALLGLAPGDELLVVTWLHQARRDVLQVHPRSDPMNALAGVFATRSPDRPTHPTTRLRECQPCTRSDCQRSTRPFKTSPHPGPSIRRDDKKKVVGDDKERSCVAGDSPR